MFLPLEMTSILRIASTLLHHYCPADNYSPEVVIAPIDVADFDTQYLPFVDERVRKAVLKRIVAANLDGEIRLSIRGVSEREAESQARWNVRPQLDFETSVGNYNSSILDVYDEILASVWELSKGRTKVIITPHGPRNFDKGVSAGLYCDVYCQLGSESSTTAADGFYHSSLQSVYKNRLSYIFTRYQSQGFNGVSWSKLDNVISAIDLKKGLGLAHDTDLTEFVYSSETPVNAEIWIRVMERHFDVIMLKKWDGKYLIKLIPEFKMFAPETASPSTLPSPSTPTKTPEAGQRMHGGDHAPFNNLYRNWRLDYARNHPGQPIPDPPWQQQPSWQPPAYIPPRPGQ